VEEVLRETADKVGEAQVLSNGDGHLETNFSHIFSHMVRVHGIGNKCSYYWKISQNMSYAF
jgi:hypothetical protein